MLNISILRRRCYLLLYTSFRSRLVSSFYSTGRCKVDSGIMEDSNKKNEEMDYQNWSYLDLVDRVKLLEKTIHDHGIIPPPFSPLTQTHPEAPEIQPRKKRRIFDPKRYSTRLIALKIAYLGGNYNGYEYHANNTTPLPTIEEKIFEALLKARLVGPKESQLLSSSDLTTVSAKTAINLWPGDDIVQYSKCGRTDKGVSAFGQVIGIRVRSNRPLSTTSSTTVDPKPTTPFDEIKDELPYVQILNRLLPEDIQVLAWCPSPPGDFSARYNCRARHYRYFFTNPALQPGESEGVGEGVGIGWLNIPKMRLAASYFLGEHDFRNFCKLDPSKQITNFKRHILYSDIEEYNPSTSVCHHEGKTLTNPPKIYFLNLKGTAFLWHQVRHMVAILFLIGQGLEKPEIVKNLLDIDSNSCKPSYEMADDKPLVLWDCTFPETEIKWIYGEKTSNRIIIRDGLVDNVWKIWYRSRIDEVLRAELVNKVYEIRKMEYIKEEEEQEEQEEQEKEEKEDLLPFDGDNDGIKIKRNPQLLHSNTFGKNNREIEIDKLPSSPLPPPQPQPQQQAAKNHILIDGSGQVLLRGKYVPILQRRRQEHIDILNERYRNKKPEKTGLGKAKREREREKEKLLLQEEEEKEVDAGVVVVGENETRDEVVGVGFTGSV